MTTKVTVFNHGPKDVVVGLSGVAAGYEAVVQPGIGQEFYVHTAQSLRIDEATQRKSEG